MQLTILQLEIDAITTIRPLLAIGNKIQMEVGIYDINGNDVPQPEYAIYRWEYNSPVEVDLLSREYSPRHTGGAGGYLYTDYEYEASGHLKRVIESSDAPGGSRPTTEYLYNNFGQVKKTIDPLGRETESTWIASDF